MRRTPKNQVEDEVFRDLCRAYADKVIAPNWEQADETSVFPRQVYTEAASAGLLGITAPEDIGGGDLGSVQEAICLEECCKINPNLPISLLIQNISGSLLWEYGSPAQRDVARQNIAGERLLALAVTEPEAGNDVQNVQTSAIRDGKDWVLSGMKSFITLGGDADTLVVLAQTDPAKGRRGMAFFVVDRESDGLVPSKIQMHTNRPAPTYRISLNDVRVPEANRVDAGFTAIMTGFNRERVMVAARWLGHSQHALDWGLQYAKERMQFGKPIGANQSIAFPLAQCYVDIEAARHMTYYAARRWDSGLPVKDIILDVSSAKLFSTQAVVRITQAALHTGGGWGLTKELPVMRMALDALTSPVTVGSFEIQLRAIAKQLGLPCD